jgi:hypothetical protein
MSAEHGALVTGPVGRLGAQGQCALWGAEVKDWLDSDTATDTVIQSGGLGCSHLP